MARRSDGREWIDNGLFWPLLVAKVNAPVHDGSNSGRRDNAKVDLPAGASGAFDFPRPGYIVKNRAFDRVTLVVVIDNQ